MPVRLLGPIEVESADGRIAIGGSVQQAVLALLALQRGYTLTVDQLLEGAWSSPPTSGARVVRVAVSRLRPIVEAIGGVIETTSSGYALRLPEGELDVELAEVHVDRARQLASVDPAACASSLRSALALWRGTPLAGLAHLPGLAPAAVWLDRWRSVLLTDRIDADLAAGRHSQLVGELESLLAADPLNERHWGQLGLALDGSGRHAEALRAFQRARDALADVGISLGPALLSLERSILSRDAAPGTAPDQRVSVPPPTSLVDAAGREHPIKASRAVIGSAANNDLVIDEPSVSRAHALLEWLGSAWIVRDLGSRNGTFRNGERVQGDNAVHDGDMLSLGRSLLQLRVATLGGGRPTETVEAPPPLVGRLNAVMVALAAPLLEGDLLDDPASIDAVARELGESVASVTTAVAEVADLLGVDPAFAAREAVARGIIRPTSVTPTGG